MKYMLADGCGSSLFRWRLSIAVVLAMLSGQTHAEDASWWQLLGPQGNGHSTAANLPLEWSDSRNVIWKTAIHDRGWSSPVVWGNQIWLTTATRDGHRLFAVCVDKDTGEILHDIHLFDVANPMRITDENTYATPTPVIEEGRVFVHFGTYGTACLDTVTGAKLWVRRDLNCDHEAGAGPASSPTLIDGRFVVHVDGRDVQYIIALDRATGKTVWKTPRSADFTNVPVNQRKAFCMPVVIPRGEGSQVVSVGGRAVYSYDLSGNVVFPSHHGQSSGTTWCSQLSIETIPSFGLSGLTETVMSPIHMLRGSTLKACRSVARRCWSKICFIWSIVPASQPVWTRVPARSYGENAFPASILRRPSAQGIASICSMKMQLQP